MVASWPFTSDGADVVGGQEVSEAGGALFRAGTGPNGGGELNFGTSGNGYAYAWDFQPGLDKTYTVEHWIKPGASTNSQHTFSFATTGDDNNLLIEFHTDPSSCKAWLLNGNGGVADLVMNPCTQFSVLRNKWSHAAFVRDGDIVKFYLDGTLVSTRSTGGGGVHATGQ